VHVVRLLCPTLVACSHCRRVGCVESLGTTRSCTLSGLIREKDPEEIDDTVQAFLNLRPDGFALNVKKQEIAILEFTRTMTPAIHADDVAYPVPRLH